ncbi:MAG: acyl-CoA dehydrogenase [Deltaproteobacteria bacterium]|nr:acyl-CoA dehydrogenase [Deltaproteobacteria bacterium]
MSSLGSIRLGFDLSDEQELICQTAQQFARDVVAPGAAERDQNHRFDASLIEKMGELGLLGIKVSADDGGVGADTVSYALALSAIAEACASTAVTMAVCNLAGDVLSAFGNDAQKQKWLAPYLEGKGGAGTFCLSEPQAGSDPRGMKTTAVKEGDEYVLNGSKQWITNGTYAGLHLVFARTDPDAGARGMSCFLVEKGTPGLIVGEPEKKMGLRSSNTVGLTFEDCRVPAANLIGGEGQGYGIALSCLDGGRVGIGAQCIGIAKAAIDEGVKYANERKCFGEAVSRFQNSQFAIADSQLELEAMVLLTLRAAAERDQHGKAAKSSSMAKVYASEGASRIVDRMLQLHGGYGYVEDYPIERLYRDVRVTRIYEGTSEVQRMVIGRSLLG